MKYAKQENNTINIYNSLPATYNGIMNFRNSSEKTKQYNGFYPLIEPAITEYQELVNLHFDEVNQVFTYDVRDFTQEEIDAYNAQKAFEAMQAFKQKTRLDGEAYYNEIDIKITAQLYGRPQTEVNPLVIEIDEKIMPVMNLVKDGQWYSALIKAMATPDPTSQEVLDGFNEVKAYISNYVTENYS